MCPSTRTKDEPERDSQPPKGARHQPRLDESRYRVHRLSFAGGLLAFFLGLLLSGSAHAACLLGGGALLAVSGVLGLLLGRNVVIEVLREAVSSAANKPPDRDAAAQAHVPLHHTTAPSGPTAEDRRHAHLISAIYLLVGLWWLVMAATWWLD